MKTDDFFIDRPIGVIIPPPDIRKHIDKTATYVANHGSNFEKMLKQDEQNLPKFSFFKGNRSISCVLSICCVKNC